MAFQKIFIKREGSGEGVRIGEFAENNLKKFSRLLFRITFVPISKLN